MRVARLNQHFFIDEEGNAKKMTVDKQQLSPVGRGVLAFAMLVQSGDSFRGEMFQAETMKEAAKRVGKDGLIGMPVGKRAINRNGKLGFVFQVVRVEDL